MMRLTAADIVGLSIAASVALAVACGSEGSNDGSSPDAGPGTSSSGGSSSGGSSGASSSGVVGTGGIDLATYADRYCKAFTPCCSKYGYAEDFAKCVKAIGTAQQDLLFDGPQAEKCVLAWEEESKEADFCRAPNSPRACSEVWKRATAQGPGATCKDDADCTSSPEGFVDCAQPKASEPNNPTVCRLDVRGKSGDACDGTADSQRDFSPDLFAPLQVGKGRVVICYLDEGLYCDEVTKTCAARKPAGETCKGDESCAADTTCDLGDAGFRCTPRGGVGAACGSSSECLDGHYCTGAPGTCQPKKANGATCMEAYECIGTCTNGTCGDRQLISALPYVFFCGPKN